MLINVLKGYGVPDRIVNAMFTDAIEITLRNISEERNGSPPLQY